MIEGRPLTSQCVRRRRFQLDVSITDANFRYELVDLDPLYPIFIGHFFALSVHLRLCVSCNMNAGR